MIRWRCMMMHSVDNEDNLLHICMHHLCNNAHGMVVHTRTSRMYHIGKYAHTPSLSTHTRRHPLQTKGVQQLLCLPHHIQPTVTTRLPIRHLTLLCRGPRHAPIMRGPPGRPGGPCGPPGGPPLWQRGLLRSVGVHVKQHRMHRRCPCGEAPHRQHARNDRGGQGPQHPSHAQTLKYSRSMARRVCATAQHAPLGPPGGVCGGY